MIKQLHKTIALAILLTINWLNAVGQTEFFVTINPNTGGFAIIDSIPGVTAVAAGPCYTTFDENNHRYIFKGGDDLGNWYLYTIDAATGAVLSNPSFPIVADPLDIVHELHYDNSSNNLYGLYLDNSENVQYFGTINPATGQFTAIDSLPAVKRVWYSAFDENNRRYIFKGTDASGNNYLYSVDANTGTIVLSPPFPVLPDTLGNHVSKLWHHDSLNMLFGLYWSPSEDREYFVSLNPNTGVFTLIDSLPGVKLIGHSTLDQNNNRYIFQGIDAGGNEYLYSVDIGTGAIVSNPSFPTLNSGGNVVEYEYDNATNTLFALHWGDHTSVTAIEQSMLKLYPNPFSQEAKIAFDRPYGEIRVTICNSLGQLVRIETGYNVDTINIQKNNLAAGTYFVTVVCDGKKMGIKKMVVD